MGQLLLQYLEGDHLYVCSKCNTHLTSFNQRLSKGFQARTGKAFLFLSGFYIEGFCQGFYWDFVRDFIGILAGILWVSFWGKFRLIF
jgi:hypothetical protein